MTTPVVKSKGSRKHKVARSSDKRKQHLAHAGKAERRADRGHKERRERNRAGGEGHHADNSPPARGSL